MADGDIQSFHLVLLESVALHSQRILTHRKRSQFKAAVDVCQRESRETGPLLRDVDLGLRNKRSSLLRDR